jgi:tetratricopeptide (TPR) repeat protein
VRRLAERQSPLWVPTRLAPAARVPPRVARHPQGRAIPPRLNRHAPSCPTAPGRPPAAEHAWTEPDSTVPASYALGNHTLPHGGTLDERAATDSWLSSLQTPEDLARALRELRRRHARRRSDTELTYRELSATSGYAHSVIGDYFTGKTLPPTDRLDVLVVLLGATSEEQKAFATARDRIEERRRNAPPPVPSRQLPAATPHFVGRSAELAMLTALAEAEAQTRVVVAAITGMAGVGKTTLALQWAHQIAASFPDGQLHVNLRGFDPAAPAGQVDPAEALRDFLTALGVAAPQIPPALDARAALYRSVLAGRKVLIVLDNAHDSAQVRPLLPGTPGCLVLVTSRNQLSGLVADGARPLALDVLTPPEAHEFLAARLGPARLAAEPQAAAELITRCAYLPLALAIVVARAAAHPAFPLQALAAELRGDQARPATHIPLAGSPPSPGLPRTALAPDLPAPLPGPDVLDALGGFDQDTDVRAVFSWSYRALTPGAARLFRLLGLHPGPDIGAASAASMAGLSPATARPLLAELAETSLAGERLPGRYALHDLLRAYAAGQARGADRPPQRRTAMHRVLDHYLYSAVAAAGQIDPSRDPITLPRLSAKVTPEHPADRKEALAWYSAEHPVLLGAIGLAAEMGLDTHVWQLAWALWPVLYRQGYWHDQINVQRAAVAAAQRLENPQAQVFAHRGLADTYAELRRFDDADAHFRHALELSAQAGDQVGQARTEIGLGYMLERQGRYAEALDHSSRALDLYRAASHQRGQARALSTVGWLHALLGDYPRTLATCQQALALLEDLGDRYGQAATWDSLGYAHHHLDAYPQAVTCYQRSLTLWRDAGARYGEATTLIRLGDTHHASAQPAQASEAWQLAITILDELGDPDAEKARSKLAALPPAPDA